MRALSLIPVIVAVLSTFVVAETYDGAFTASWMHGDNMHRDPDKPVSEEFHYPVILGKILREGRVGKHYPDVKVEYTFPPINDHWTVNSIRAPAEVRRFIVLGPRYSQSPRDPGIAVAFPVDTKEDSSDDHKLFAFLSVERTSYGDLVHFNGYATVHNAAGLQQHLKNMEEPLQVTDVGSVLNTHELFRQPFLDPSAVERLLLENLRL